MDALKKAELAKGKGSDSASTPSLPDTGPDTGVSNVSASSADTVSLPTLSERLELLDDEFVAMAARSPRPSAEQSSTKNTPTSNLTMQEMTAPASAARALENRTAAAKSDDAHRGAVQNLFETKQPAPSRKKFAALAGSGVVLAVAAIGFYFWNEMQPKPGFVASNTVRPAAVSPPLPIATAPVATPAPLSLAESPPHSEVASNEKKEAAPNVDERGESRTPSAPAKKLFHVSAATPPSNQSLDRAYDALTRGDNTVAKATYEKVLGVDAKNVDALSGLAVIAQRSGNPEQAADFYLKILEADPKNASAMAGLVDLQSQMNPGVAELRLKQALATQPDSAALNFSLGNIYAKTKRWTDAQQAFFKASTADPGNPDYLFNLAVSLDQMHQPGLAAKYYEQALAASDARPTAIDRSQARERLLKLQQLP